MAIPAAFTASSDSASTPPLPNPQQHRRCVWVNGPVIVGAGPSGLAVAACLHEQGVPYVILERADCVASLWQRRTYDRLKLHLPKRFCQLPGLPIPDEFPEYPTRDQFVAYLEDYARKFEIAPRFRHSVRSARREGDMWRVVAAVANEGKEEIKGGGDGRKQEEEEEVEYMCQWVVVATGENAEPVVPEFEGSGLFPGKALHACEYRSGEAFRGEKVLVIGCGNSGMEVCLDLCIHGAKPYMVVRDAVHVLPRDILGKSTFELSTLLSKHLPLCLVDKLLVLASLLTFGSMTKYGLRRPEVGPLELKQRDGKTPVLDLGAMGKIKSGEIQVVPGITRFTTDGVQLSDGRELDVDSVVFATGYRSNVPWWLQDKELFGKDGYPKRPFPNGWKGEGGLYSAGFTKRGLAGAAMDAIKVAEDISRAWKEETMRATTRRTQQQHQHRHGDRQRTCISHA